MQGQKQGGSGRMGENSPVGGNCSFQAFFKSHESVLGAGCVCACVSPPPLFFPRPPPQSVPVNFRDGGGGGEWHFLFDRILLPHMAKGLGFDGSPPPPNLWRIFEALYCCKVKMP